MKKILTAAMVAALAFSFAGCSDDDKDENYEPCFEPTLKKTLASYNKLGADAAEIGKITDKTADEYLTKCSAFYDAVKASTDEYKDYNRDAMTAEWERYKNTDGWCKAAYILQASIDALSAKQSTDNIKLQFKQCGEALIAAPAYAAKYTQDAFADDQTSLNTWSTVLYAAADYTAGKAAENSQN